MNGRTALAHAVRHADIVAPTMLGRTREDGQHHDVRWEASRLDATIESMRIEAGARWDRIELHALVQAVVVTEDRAHATSEIAGRIGMDVSDALSTPFLCLGTHAEIAEHLLACRERWGFSYFSVRDLDAFAPVLALLREHHDDAGEVMARAQVPGIGRRTGSGSGSVPSSGSGSAAGPSRVRSGSSSTAPIRKQTAPTNVPRFVRATLSSWPLDVT